MDSPEVNAKAAKYVQEMWQAIEKRPLPSDHNFNYVHVDTAVGIAKRHLDAKDQRIAELEGALKEVKQSGACDGLSILDRIDAMLSLNPVTQKT